MSASSPSWPNLQPLPAKRARLSVQREFTEQELERIRPGFIPEHMEDKWCLLMEGNTLYIHRSWTGNCIYQVHLVRQDTKYVIGEAFVNRDESQYAGTNDLYDEKQLVFLIEYLLLKKRSPLPMPVTVTAGISTELHHHHVLGAGQRAERGPIHVTLDGTLKWLWRWLISLVRR